MAAITVRELRDHTTAVLHRVQAGEDLVVTRNGVPVARLAPVSTTGTRRPVNRADLIALLDQHAPDPDFAADIAALTSETTDDLGAL